MTLTNIVINVLLSATSVFIYIESANAYRNHKKFEKIKVQCYNSLNKFSKFFIKNLIDKFLFIYRKTPPEIIDKMVNNDLQKFLNQEINASEYFVRADNPAFYDSSFYGTLITESRMGEKLSNDYNLRKIEEIYINYLLVLDKDNSELINILFSLIYSIQEFEANIGHPESFKVYDQSDAVQAYNQIITACAKIYNKTDELISNKKKSYI